MLTGVADPWAAKRSMVLAAHTDAIKASNSVLPAGMSEDALWPDSWGQQKGLPKAGGAPESRAKTAGTVKSHKPKSRPTRGGLMTQVREEVRSERAAKTSGFARPSV